MVQYQRDCSYCCYQSNFFNLKVILYSTVPIFLIFNERQLCNNKVVLWQALILWSLKALFARHLFEKLSLHRRDTQLWWKMCSKGVPLALKNTQMLQHTSKLARCRTNTALLILVCGNRKPSIQTGVRQKEFDIDWVAFIWQCGILQTYLDISRQMPEICFVNLMKEYWNY